MSLDVSARTQTRTPKFTVPTTRPLTTTITRVVFLRIIQMATSPPSEQVSRTLIVCDVTSPVPFAVSRVIISVSAMLVTYAGRAPSRLTASIAPSATGMALMFRYSPISRHSSTVSTPAISSTSALGPMLSIGFANR